MSEQVALQFIKSGPDFLPVARASPACQVMVRVRGPSPGRLAERVVRWEGLRASGPTSPPRWGRRGCRVRLRYARALCLTILQTAWSPKTCLGDPPSGLLDTCCARIVRYRPLIGGVGDSRRCGLSLVCGLRRRGLRRGAAEMRPRPLPDQIADGSVGLFREAPSGSLNTSRVTSRTIRVPVARKSPPRIAWQGLGTPPSNRYSRHCIVCVRCRLPCRWGARLGLGRATGCARGSGLQVGARHRVGRAKPPPPRVQKVPPPPSRHGPICRRPTSLS